MYNPPKEYLEALKKDILEALKNPKTEPIAAFDADGTIWFSDVGRDFFDYQIETNYFPGGKSLNWEDYQKVEDLNMERGLCWLGEIFEGEHIDALRVKVNEFHLKKKPVYIPLQKELIKFLKDNGVQVYIVTASIGWTIEAGAKELGLEPKDIIGIKTEIKDGIITNKTMKPVSWAEGKVDALLEATDGKMPFLVSGNTISDCHMIELSTHFKQVIHGVDDTSVIYETEKLALEKAKKEGWHYVDYMNNECSLK